MLNHPGNLLHRPKALVLHSMLEAYFVAQPLHSRQLQAVSPTQNFVSRYSSFEMESFLLYRSSEKLSNKRSPDVTPSRP
jgi:hypothetical protein